MNLCDAHTGQFVWRGTGTGEALTMNTLTIVSEAEWCRRASQLAAEMSSELIGLTGDDVPTAVEGAMRRIGETLEVDRSTLVEFSDQTVRATYHWASDDAPPVDLSAHVPRLTRLLDRIQVNGEAIVLERIPDGLPLEAVVPGVMEHLREMAMRSAVMIPIAVAGQRVSALAVEMGRTDRTWPRPLVARLRLMAEILTIALTRVRQEEGRSRQSDAARLTAVLDAGPVSGTEQRSGRPGLDEIVGDSAALKAVLQRLNEVTPTQSTVLLLGETGTGKELIARALHTNGPRKAYPLVTVNCAALPPTLIESELFGHERGAFTGAVAPRAGRFQLAHRGTLFLDEIGDLPMELQSKLLRVLQEGEFEPIGSSQTRKVSVRIVAATHRDLARAVAEGEFRDDLYYRLSVFPIRLPSLRERREDIPALVWNIIHKRQNAMHRSIKKVPPAVMDTLQAYTWPGNVRELENVIERALIHSPSDTLQLLDDRLDTLIAHPPAGAGRLSVVERTHIEEVLRKCRWRINGAGNAADRLGLHPNTLRYRMKKLGIARDSAA